MSRSEALLVRKALSVEIGCERGEGREKRSSDLQQIFQLLLLCTLSLDKIVGQGGPLVDSMPFVRRFVGSNPVLAAT